MTMEEDDRPRPAAQLMPSPPLDRLGIDELHAYIARLHSEVARAQSEIARKLATLDVAHGVFRTPGPTGT